MRDSWPKAKGMVNIFSKLCAAQLICPVLIPVGTNAFLHAIRCYRYMTFVIAIYVSSGLMCINLMCVDALSSLCLQLTSMY